MFTTADLRFLARVTVNNVEYVVYTDEAYTHAVTAADWRATRDVEYEDYTAWCCQVPAVDDADLARSIIEASDGDVRAIHLSGTCQAVTARADGWADDE